MSWRWPPVLRRCSPPAETPDGLIALQLDGLEPLEVAEHRLVRGIGFIKTTKDIEEAVVTVKDNVPVQIKHVAKVAWGPQIRLGALDKQGAEAVGGVVVARYGSNPLAVIKNVKKKIEEISPGLPIKTLADGTERVVKVEEFVEKRQY